MGKLILLAGLMLFLLIFGSCVSAYLFSNSTVRFVEFNGNWSNGTVLYSDVYVIERNASIYGRDIFPVNYTPQNTRTRVCENYTRIKYRRVCTNNTLGYRVVTKKVCSRIGGFFGETVCEEKEYNITTRARKICTREPYEEQYEKCKWVRTNQQKVGCLNSDGSYSNVLNLDNFEYSFDNVIWTQVPYIENHLDIFNESVYFKLEAPVWCDSDFNYNEAVFIEEPAPSGP